jgi:hypothetical protein
MIGPANPNAWRARSKANKCESIPFRTQQLVSRSVRGASDKSLPNACFT